MNQGVAVLSNGVAVPSEGVTDLSKGVAVPSNDLCLALSCTLNFIRNVEVRTESL